MKNLLGKLFNTKRDYIEIIPIEGNIEKEIVNEFLNEVKLNKGKVKSIQIGNNSQTRWEHTDEFDAGIAKADPYSHGYTDKVTNYIHASSYFIVHYRCNKELKYKEKLIPEFHFDAFQKNLSNLSNIPDSENATQ